MPSVSIERFIELCVHAPNTATLVKHFDAIMQEFGFDVVAYHVIQRLFRTLSADAGERLLGGQLDVADFFKGGREIGFDPLIDAAIKGLEPFHWFVAEQHPELSDQQRKIFQYLRHENFADGICIPVITRIGDLALFSLSKRGSTFSFTKAQLRLLQFACQAMDLRYNELAEGEPEHVLTSRESEVMARVVLGKSKPEIAREVRVSAHTVDTLIRRSYLKLGVNNRVEASIKLIYSGLLSKTS